MYEASTESRIYWLQEQSLIRDLTAAESREALDLVREGRVSAGYTSAGSKTKKSAAAPVNGLALLDKLKALGSQTMLPIGSQEPEDDADEDDSDADDSNSNEK